MLGNEEMGSACSSAGKAFAPMSFKKNIFEKMEEEYEHFLWYLHVDTHTWKTSPFNPPHLN